MVALTEIRRANEQLRTTHPSPTALFVGATAGIGLAAVRSLLARTASPTVILVGRSATRFAPTLADLRALNPRATVTFVEGEVSLLREVARVAGEVRATAPRLDLLVLSAGYLSFGGRETTAEGLTAHVALVYYARMMFVRELLPSLRAGHGAVVSVLAGGQEGGIRVDDLGLVSEANYGLVATAVQTGTMTTLAMREVARAEGDTVRLIHMYPGMVATTVLDKTFATLTGLWAPIGWLGRWVLAPLINLAAVSAEDVGERVVHMGLTDRYPAGKGGDDGLWRLNQVGEDTPKTKALEEYEKNGTGTAVWKHTLEVFDKTLAGQ